MRGIFIVFALAASVAAIYFGLPKALNALGLHPHYDIPPTDLSGRRALVVTTSHGVLEPKSKRTGVFASEMTVPYYAFLDAGMEVDIASVDGGDIPIEPGSLDWPIATAADRRFRNDPAAREKTARSMPISAADIERYDIVFLAGGWGAAYDLGTSEAVGEQVSRAWANGAVVGGVCHGPLGLLKAVDETGAPLVRGRRLTAVTDKQIRELGITFTPQHPERELRAAGALFEAGTAFPRLFRHACRRRRPARDRTKPEFGRGNIAPNDVNPRQGGRQVNLFSQGSPPRGERVEQWRLPGARRRQM